MSATWAFDAVDVTGEPLTEGGLTLQTGAQLGFQLIAPNTFQCLLPLTSPEAQNILSDTVDPYIKGYRTPEGGTTTDAALKFYGPIWVDQVIGQNGIDQLMIVALEPTAILMKRFALDNYLASDLGAVLMDEIDRTNSVDGETGIRTNIANISASSNIDIDNSTNKPSIHNLGEQFAQQLDGCEFWTEPIELAAGKICDFYAASSRGNATDVVFGYGDTTDANCSAMGRTRDKAKVANTINGYTDALTSQRLDLTSIAAIRNLVEYVSFTGETSQDALDSRTQGRLDAVSTRAKVAEYTCKPTSAAPRLFDDFDIGDDVFLHFRKGIEWGVNQRVRSAKLNISNGGVEIPESIGFRE